MTAPQHSALTSEETATVALVAAHDVVCILLQQMSPKKERAARRQIDRFIAQLETYEGQRLPLNVVPIRQRNCDTPAARVKRQRLAANIRQIAEPVLS